MSKATVTRLFLGAITALAVGLVMAIGAVVAALAGGAIHIGGPNVVDVDGAALAGVLPWLLVAGLVFVAGEVAAVVSWIGALMNTYRFEDKTWFVALLVLGVLSLGWVAMVAYVVAGHDSTNPAARRPRAITTAGT